MFRLSLQGFFTKRNLNMSEKWFAIANPQAGSGKSKELLSFVTRELKRNKIDFLLNLTTISGDEIKLVKKATSLGYRKILCIGGDGTLQKVIAGIQIQKNISKENVLFGLVPLGTGNDWAKSRGISLKISESISLLKSGKRKTQDVGVANIKTSEKEIKRYFITYSGVGFDSFMLKKIHKYKWLGKLSYLFCAIMNFMNYKNIEVEIKTDNAKINSKVFLLGVGLCKFTGGGMQLIKTPAGNNGRLNMTIAQDLRKTEIIKIFFSLFNGGVFSKRKVLTMTSEKILIVAKNTVLTCQGDGEIFGDGKVSYSIVKKGLHYIC